MSDSDRSSRYPYTVARSTGTAYPALLAALLAAPLNIDEVSSAEDFVAFEQYVIHHCMPDENGITQSGHLVWLYPEGLYRTYHETEEGNIEHHGLLVTIERGARLSDVVERARSCLRGGVLAHEHVAAAA